MAYKTWLQCVNEVQRRLRENVTPSVSSTDYSALLGVFVNDIKREVEDAWNWNVLRNTVSVPSGIGTATYTLTGTSNRSRILDVFDDTNDYTLSSIRFDRKTANILGGTSNNQPKYYKLAGENSSGELLVTLLPTPDGVYTIRFDVVIPQDDCVSNSDEIYVPSDVVILGAYARAVEERGEDGGQTSMSAFGRYREALGNSISRDEALMVFETDWTAV
jgi:hypothetical protein